MVLLKTTLLVACLAASSHFNPQASALQPSLYSDITASAALVANAPAAQDVQGVHLLLDNDVDSKTPKHPVILLSKPRSYKDSQALCSAMGESMLHCSLVIVVVYFVVLWCRNEIREREKMCY